MSEPTIEPTPAPSAPAPAPAAPAAPEAKPPWGSDEEFNAEKAWNLIQGLKADKERLTARKVLTPEAEQKLTEYDALVEASKTDLERAQEAARKATEQANALVAAARQTAAAAKVEAALTGIVPNPAEVVGDLNIANFLTPEGDVDTDKVEALKTRYAAIAPSGTRIPAPNPAQGSSSSPPPAGPAQLTQDDVKRLYEARRYDEISKARAEGRLTELLGG